MKTALLLSLVLALPAAAGVAAPSATKSRSAEDTIEQWPEKTRDIARRMLAEYGDPESVDPAKITWRDNGPWKRTVVYRGPQDRRRQPLEQTVEYKVPVPKIKEVLQFDNTLLIDRSTGELTARSDSEDRNFLTLNLVHEIAAGKRTVNAARLFYTKTMALSFAGKNSAYLEGLLFKAED